MVAIVAFSPGLCVVAAEPGANTSGDSSVTTDEVLVSAMRLKDLREAVIKAEDRMLARYSELNPDKDLDIECAQFTPTGTHFTHRYCMTRLQKRAQEKDSREFLSYMSYMSGLTAGGGAAPSSETGIRLMERAPDYRKNLTKLLEDHPDLRELLVERGNAERRYIAERSKRTKGKVPQ